MSVDPASPSTSEPVPSKPAPSSPAGRSEDAAADTVELAKIKKRFRKGIGGAETEEEEKPDQAIELVSSLLQDLIAKKEQRTAPEAETKTAKYHRLAKSARPVGGGAAGPAEAAVPSDGSPPESGAVALTPPASTPPPSGFRPAEVFVSAADRRKTRRRSVIYALCSLALAAGAFYAGRQFAPAETDLSLAKKDVSVTARARGSVWTDPLIDQLDHILTADRAGNLESAIHSAEALSSQAGTLPGLDLYQPALVTRNMRTSDAEATLTRLLYSSTAPLRSAAINERLGFNFSRSRDFEKASEYLAAAARLDPFSAPLFYRWAESLRHGGHLEEAAAKFRQALLRIPTGQPETESMRECAEFKLRLTLIEVGKEAELQPALDEHLKASAPSGYWLLTAAALALQHSDLPGAAGFLGRARDTLGGEQFDALLNDYFFRPFADRKEVAEFFPTDPVARRAKLLPSMAYSVEP